MCDDEWMVRVEEREMVMRKRGWTEMVRREREMIRGGEKRV